MSRHIEINQDIDRYISKIRRKDKFADTARKAKHKAKHGHEDLEVSKSKVEKVIEEHPIKQEHLDHDEHPSVEFIEGKGVIGWIKGLFSSPQTVEIIEGDDLDEEMTPTEHVRHERIDHEFSEAEHDVEHSKSFWAKLSEFFSGGEHEEKEQEVVVLEEEETKKKDEETKKDIERSLKVSLELMKRLPSPDFKRFKNSENFEDYKQLLKKYEIKKL